MISFYLIVMTHLPIEFLGSDWPSGLIPMQVHKKEVLD